VGACECVLCCNRANIVYSDREVGGGGDKDELSDSMMESGEWRVESGEWRVKSEE
jgi:hypothetical protein